jgi:predicted ATP-grasp superfamily ATP-dependent carboligase
VKIFVYEHMNGGALAGIADGSSLRSEGRAMLAAVLADLQSCPGAETLALLDGAQIGVGRAVHVSNAVQAVAAFRALAREADRTLVIAPELGGILEARCQWVEEEGGLLLGPSSAAVGLTTDKLTLASHLSCRGIPTPATSLVDGQTACPFPFPVVVKPRDGAGSVATTLIESPEMWRRREKSAQQDGWSGDRIVQPFASGMSASVAVLVGERGLFALAPTSQHLSDDGRFHYRGGAAPLPAAEAHRASELARRAVAAVPGLKGYVGVDLVLGADEDGRGDSVIEINPRLTTSYIGLRELARFNLAVAILAACEGTPMPEFAWHAGPVCWSADGAVALPRVPHALHPGLESKLQHPRRDS